MDGVRRLWLPCVDLWRTACGMSAEDKGAGRREYKSSARGINDKRPTGLYNTCICVLNCQAREREYEFPLMIVF